MDGTPTTRFANLSPGIARIILGILAALMVFGIWSSVESIAPASLPRSRAGDIALHRAIVERVRAGESYENAAVAEHRAQGFPVRPFLAVRPPFLAMFLGQLPNERTTDFLLTLLAICTTAAWAVRLFHIFSHPLARVLSVLVLFTGIGMTVAGGGASLFHEAWAGLLIALSLALRTERRFAAAVVVGLMAALFRELAMPYLLVMAVVALAERRKLESLTFAVALGVALAALGLHARVVYAITSLSDPASPGWLQLGGWRFVLATANWNLIVLATGSWAAALLIPLAILGAIGWQGGTGLRLAILLLGYVAGFLVVGRPENNYWGLITAPLMGLALAFSPAVLTDLIKPRRKVESNATDRARA